MSPGPKRPRLEVHVSDEHGKPVGSALARWLAAVAPASARGRVDIALVSDRTIRTLNRRYRKLDKTTDVLSFPSDSGTKRAVGSRRSGLQPPASSPHLGDIVIAQGVATRQARAAGHDVATEFCVLALHGLLHLLGYDHEVDAGTMARVERRLRRKGGLREGLIERQ